MHKRSIHVRNVRRTGRRKIFRIFQQPLGLRILDRLLDWDRSPQSQRDGSTEDQSERTGKLLYREATETKNFR